MPDLGVINRCDWTKVQFVVLVALIKRLEAKFVTFSSVVTSWKLAKTLRCQDLHGDFFAENDDRADYFTPCEYVWGNNQCLQY